MYTESRLVQRGQNVGGPRQMLTRYETKKVLMMTNVYKINLYNLEFIESTIG